MIATRLKCKAYFAAKMGFRGSKPSKMAHNGIIDPGCTRSHLAWIGRF
jgi:hypothetical protein